MHIMVIMFSDMNMFHVSDILKKNVVEFTFKRKHFFQMFFALFHAQHGYQLVKNLLNSQLNHFEFESVG